MSTSTAISKIEGLISLALANNMHFVLEGPDGNGLFRASAQCVCRTEGITAYVSGTEIHQSPTLALEAAISTCAQRRDRGINLKETVGEHNVKAKTDSSGRMWIKRDYTPREDPE